MKKLILMSMLSLTACANNLPEIGSGITIKPLKELNEEAYKKYMLHKKAFNSFTPEESKDNYAQIIRDNVELKGVDLYTYSLSDNPNDTEIRKNLKQLKLSFNFVPVKNSDLIYTTGFAPMGQYTKDGWTGVTQYFRHYKIGHCIYEYTAYDIKHGAIWLPRERVSYLVGGKTTMLHNYGNKNDGYVYSVKWYDDNYIAALQCSSPKSDNQLSLSVIELANDISN